MSGGASSPVPADHPLMRAWNAYKATEDYANTRTWAGVPRHTEGSLWAAFERGWCAGGGLQPFQELESAPAGDAVDPHVAKQERGPRAGESSSRSNAVRLAQLREGLRATIEKLTKTAATINREADEQQRIDTYRQTYCHGKAFGIKHAISELAALLAASDETPK